MKDEDDTNEGPGLVPLFEAIADEWEQHSRARGIYTDTDRKYLWGINEYADSPEARSRRRKAVRDRTVNGLSDLYYLPMIDEDLWSVILDEIEERDSQTAHLRGGVSRLIEFLWRSGRIDENWLEAVIKSAIEHSERFMDDAERWGDYTVDVDIRVSKGYNLDELKTQLREGEAQYLSTEEVGALVRGADLTPEELEQLSEQGDSPYASPLYDVAGHTDRE